MRTERQEFYIRHDFSFYDSGMLACVPHQIVLLYDVLRRFVWRSDEYGAEFTQKLRREGFLVSPVRQATIGEMLGYDRPRTISENLRLLKDLGWVRVHTDALSNTTCYALGETVRDSLGQTHEVYWADAYLSGLMEALREAARAQHGPEATLRALPMSERIAFCKSYLKRHRLPSQDSDPVDPQEGQFDPLGGETPTDTPFRGHGYPPSATADTPPPQNRSSNKKGSTNPSETLEQPNATARTQRGGSAPPHPPGVGGERRGGDGEEKSQEKLPTSGSQIQTSPDAELQRLIERRREEFQNAATQNASKQLREESGKERQIDALKNGRKRSTADKAALLKLEERWRTAMGALRPGAVIAPWGPPELSKVSGLVASYGVDVVTRMVDYITSSWEEVNGRIFKGKATQPTIAMMASMHESIAAEAQSRSGTDEVSQEVQRWRREHPEEPLPQELADRYARTR